MSITASSPFILNILPIFNTPNDVTGVDTTTSGLRTDITNIQEMVNYSTKTIKTNIIGSFDTTTIQVLNPMNIPSPSPTNINTLLQNSCTNYGASNTSNGGGGGGGGGGSGSEHLGCNSYDWYFPISSIGGTGIVDSRGISRSNADTYTDAFAKVDYWIYENLVDAPPAPSPIAALNSLSSINFYWNNPHQFKFNFLNIWSPFISSMTLHLYSNAGGSNGGSHSPIYTYVTGAPYLPNQGTPIVGTEFLNNLPGNLPVVYSNATYSNYILQFQINQSQLNTSNIYSMDVSYQNYSANSDKVLLFTSNVVGALVPRAPRTTDFTVVVNNNGTISVNAVPTINAGVYLTPTPVFYYVLGGTTDLAPQTLTGSFASGTALHVTPISPACGYNESPIFYVTASNSYGSATKSVTGSTGPAPFSAAPGVSLAGSAINPTNGQANIVYSVTSNGAGTLYWSFTTPSQATSQKGTGVVIGGTFSLTPTHYFQYYDNPFTLLASNVAPCAQTYSISTIYTSSYTVTSPQMYISASSSNSSNYPPYYINVTLSNLPTPPTGVTRTTTWTNNNGTNATITSSSSNALTAIGSNTTVFSFSAAYVYTDTASATRTSAATTCNVAAGAVTHSFTGPITPIQQIPVTYPVDAIISTCTASTSPGYQFLGTPNPGATIWFQAAVSGIPDGTYFWSYQNYTP